MTKGNVCNYDLTEEKKTLTDEQERKKTGDVLTETPRLFQE